MAEKKHTKMMELRLSYVGSAYCGWQIQPHSPTVQGILQDVLRRILKDPQLKTTGASRTDTGVHAHDQHVSFQTTNSIPPEGLFIALNHALPKDIRVREVKEQPLSFSARHHARGKHYAYYIHNRRVASPFTNPLVWELGYALDAERMDRAARIFEGTRCFKALQAAGDERPGSETSIYATRVRRQGEIVWFDVTGHHFLYHMVRNMAGALVMVGRGEWREQELAERLDSGERKQMGPTAPASGLHLLRVFYGDETPVFCEESDQLAAALQFPGIA